MHIRELQKTKKTLLQVILWTLGVAAVSLFLTYYWRVAYEPSFVSGTRLTLYTFLALGAFCLLTFGVCRLCKERGTLRTVLLIFLAGLAFVFVLPPLQAPDETAHFLRSYAISCGHFDFDASRDYTAQLGALYQAFPQAFYNDYSQSIAPRFAEYAALSAGGTAAPVGETLYMLIWPYLPQAAGIAAARVLGLGALGQLYAARIANVALYAALCYPALKNCDRYRSILQSVMLLPIGLQVVAGNSYDSWLLCSAFLVFSYFAKDEITLRDLPFMLLSVLPCSLKPPQLIIVLIWLLIPKSRWHMQTKKGRRISPWLVVAGIAAAAFLLYEAAALYSTLASRNYSEIGRWNPDVDVGGQIAFVFQNLLRTLAVFWFTLYEKLFFLPGLGEFCNLDVTVPAVTLLSLFSLFTGMVLGVRKKDADTKNAALGLVLFGVLYVGVVLAALYVTWTPVGMVRVIGLQARYFIPALPAFLAAGGWLAGHVLALRPESEAKVKRAAFWLPYTVAGVSALLLFQHCFIGPF
ncbi:MAG: DUF2142 domain-containing protein [Oscillospiraceae bacterium]|nr:DUF2142 domain-containing protein [Oscillospiraceae bacterium]